jgi:hypothetical protein
MLTIDGHGIFYCHPCLLSSPRLSYSAFQLYRFEAVVVPRSPNLTRFAK